MRIRCRPFPAVQQPFSGTQLRAGRSSVPTARDWQSSRMEGRRRTSVANRRSGGDQLPAVPNIRPDQRHVVNEDNSG